MEILNWAGFLLAILAYLVVFLLIIVTKEKNKNHYLFLFLVFGGAAWSSIHFFSKFYLLFDTWIFFAESLRVASALLFIGSLTLQKESTHSRVLNIRSILFLAFVFSLPVFNSFNLVPKNWIFVCYLGLSLAALIGLELLFRKSSEEQRWGLKPLVLSLGTFFIFDFIVFADASLLSQVNQEMWIARGYLHALLVPLLLWSLKRTKDLGVNVYVSRDMVFQSGILFGAGIYLLIMAAVGYYIKSIEAEWTGLLQNVFITLAFTLLFALFVSDSLKRNLRVFIEKNFFANRFDYRAQWLALTNIINEEIEESENFYQRALKAFLFSVSYEKGAMLKLKNGELEIVANQMMPHLNVNHCPPLNEVIKFISSSSWIIDIQDYQQKPTNYPGLNLDDTSIEEIGFSVAIPLVTNKEIWGVVIMDSKKEKRIKFNWEIRDYMSVVSTQIGHFVYQQEANTTLMENAQFAAFNRMSAFVIHDLKNVLAQIDLIIRNSDKHRNNPEFIDDTFETLGYTKQRMEKMLGQLTNKNIEKTEQNKTDVGDVLRDVIDNKCQNLLPLPELTFEQGMFVSLDKEKFSNILFHLIDNAQHATADDGHIAVSCKKHQGEQNKIVVQIEDNGIGMSQDFIQNKLFTPFVTTKGNAGMGIGAYDAKMFIEQIGGKMSVASTENKGTIFTIEIPVQ